MSIAKKVSDRITAAMKRLVPVVQQLKLRDVSEADTVTVVKDILCEVFGYDKYSELTGEFAIRGTYCDLAIKVDEKVVALVEVKAIGITLNDRHIKQAVDYAANQGIEWVILTNGAIWRLNHVVFSKPIQAQQVAEIDITGLDCRNEQHREMMYLFSKEGFRKGVHVALSDKQDATSRFLLAALILHNDNVLGTIRRELRRAVDVLVSEEDIAKVLADQVIKRDALEGPQAEEAANKLRKAQSKLLKQEQPKPTSEEAPSASIKPAVPDEQPAGQEATTSAPERNAAPSEPGS